MQKLTTALALALGLSLPASNLLAQDSGQINIFGAAGVYNYDGDRRADDTEVLGLGLGYRINERWSIEAVYHDMDPSEADFAIDADGEMYHLDALYHLNERSFVTPFLAAGLGNLEVDYGTSDDNELALNFGGGVKAGITQALSVRVDARMIRGFDTNSWDNLLTIGINYAFGAKSAPKAAPAAKPSAPDSDGDGVKDPQDRCPETPAGVEVDGQGCPVDNDGDGVYDYQDQCPNTPAGARVDERGCQIFITEAVSVELEVLFDTDKSDVKQTYFSEIKKVADFMVEYPSTDATIEGHTDSSGADDYNQGLSQRRAEAVRQVLINEYKIPANRLKAVGYGESRPRASNDTASGKQLNRRVVAVIKTEVKKAAEK